MDVKRPDVICLMGPTAAGKTRLAAELTQHFPVELISVDSVQVYRGMNVGAGKPEPEFLARYPHHLIDIRDPWDQYSVGDFCRDAGLLIDEITAAGRWPLFVGGTMLYFSALQTGLAELPEADAALRAELDARAAAKGWADLHAELERLDPATAARLKPTDAQRIQRALEVCLLTEQPMSELLESAGPAADASYINIRMMPGDRSELHARIESRFDAMLRNGLVAEVENLLGNTAMSPDTPALRAVGYRQIVDYLQGRISLETARDKAIVATRRLAKRQLTWLRRWPDAADVDCLERDASEIVIKFLQQCTQGCASTGRSG